MSDIFFSYSSKDRERVRPVHDALVSLGYDVFWDQEVPPGQDWDTWIRDHLAKAQCTVVFWSENSVGSLNVRHEATRASENGKLIPILIDKLGADKLPMGHYTIQAANLAGWNGDVRDPQWARALSAIEVKVAAPDAARLKAQLRASQAALAELKAGRKSPWLPRLAAAAAVVVALAGGYLLAQTGMPKIGLSPGGESKPVSEATTTKPTATVAITTTTKPTSGDGGPSAVELYTKGSDFYFGRNNVAKDNNQAIFWFRQAAEKGHPDAMHSLGAMLLAGEGGAKDALQSLQWFKRAADKGQLDSMSEMGRSYGNGLSGLDVDYALAAQWFQKAAAKGSTSALNNLAYYYDLGRGVDQDRPKGAKYMMIAIKRGYEYCRDQMTKYSTNWSREFRVEFQKLLKAEGKFNGELNGTFGPDTVAAIEAVFGSDK